MLYKKYHRNFVKQFRIGTRFQFKYAEDERQVKQNPIISKSPTSKSQFIITYWGEFYIYDLCLVFADGTLADDVEVL